MIIFQSWQKIHGKEITFGHKCIADLNDLNFKLYISIRLCFAVYLSTSCDKVVSMISSVEVCISVCFSAHSGKPHELWQINTYTLYGHKMQQHRLKVFLLSHWHSFPELPAIHKLTVCLQKQQEFRRVQKSIKYFMCPKIWPMINLTNFKPGHIWQQWFWCLCYSKLSGNHALVVTCWPRNYSVHNRCTATAMLLLYRTSIKIVVSIKMTPAGYKIFSRGWKLCSQQLHDHTQYSASGMSTAVANFLSTNNSNWSARHQQFTDIAEHTHTTVLWPPWILSGTTCMSRYQKGKTRKVKPFWIYKR